MSLQTIANKHRVARIAHGCRMCGRTIQPGETYNHQTNVYDGGIYVWKQCAHCEAAVRILQLAKWADWPDEGIGPDLMGGFEPETIAHARIWIAWRNQWRRRDGSLRDIPQEVSRGE